MILKNISVMTVSHLVINGLAFLSIPFLVKIYGPDAYALIAFYIAFQAWLITFDMGFTPTTVRFLSELLNINKNCAGRDQSIIKFTSVYRYIFFLISFLILLISSSLFFFTDYFLKSSSYANAALSFVFPMIACMRFYTTIEKSFYRADEKFFLLSKLNIFFAAARYLLILPIIYFMDDIIFYFYYQMVVALIECIFYKNYHRPILKIFILPKISDFSILKENSSFLGISAIAGICWLAIVSLDKFFLFGNISSTSYTAYTITAQIAAMALIIIAPITSVVQPKVVEIYLNNGNGGLVEFLAKFNKFLSLFVCNIVFLLLILFPLIFPLWSSLEFDKFYLNIFLYLIFGYLFAAQGITSYLFQFGTGNIKIHGWSQLIGTIFYIPLIYYFAINKNIQEIAISWFVLMIFLHVCNFFAISRISSIYQTLQIYIPAWTVIIITYFISMYTIDFLLNWPKEYFSISIEFLLKLVAISGSITIIYLLGAYHLYKDYNK